MSQAGRGAGKGAQYPKRSLAKPVISVQRRQSEQNQRHGTVARSDRRVRDRKRSLCQAARHRVGIVGSVAVSATRVHEARLNNTYELYRAFNVFGILRILERIEQCAGQVRLVLQLFRGITIADAMRNTKLRIE